MAIKTPIYFMIITILAVLADAGGEVQRWMVFERDFVSEVEYANPVQEVRLSVVFQSPSGKERTMQGYWNGGRLWQVRFAPDEVGKWRFTTKCSDKTNQGLAGVTGEFECVAYRGKNGIYRHGNLKVSESGTYLSFDDGTPFFWLADTVWCGPLFAEYQDWKVFLEDRVKKEFTAIQFVMTQWRMAEHDADGNVTFWGKETIKINPTYFQRLDQYVAAINEAGLLAAPVLLWGIQGDRNPGYYLDEEQKVILAEYMIARYGAYQVLWFLGGDGNFEGDNAAQWKRIGRKVFRADQQRLATMHPRGQSWIGDEFRGEPWYRFIGYQSGHGDSEGTFGWLNQGPPSRDWNGDPMLPVINIEPNYEGHNGYQNKRAHDDHSVRRAAYWSLLVSPTAGVTYGGQGIWGWHEKVQAPADHVSSGLGAPWYEAKDLPGAFSMMYLHRLFKSIDWWELRPAPELLVEQPGKQNKSQFIAAAKSRTGDLAVVYLPEGGQVILNTNLLKPGCKARWYNPKVGGWLGEEQIKQPNLTFKTFDRNDWVLVITDR